MSGQTTKAEEAHDPRYGQSFIARKAAVTSPNGLASVVGHNIMQKGGNAVDAMVGVNAALGVVFPHMTGAGGDAFWIIYDSETKKHYTLNASGKSSRHVCMELYKDAETINSRGPLAAITVPGAVDGWCKAHERFGKIPFEVCLEEAIELAREGFPVSASLASFQEKSLHLLREHEATAKTYLKDGVAPYLEGDWMKNEHLAQTLEQIAQKGRDVFYTGTIAEEICNDIQKQGGILSIEDFKSHNSDWVEAVEIDYRGNKVIAPPPNSEGMTTLQILGMLEHIEDPELFQDEAKFIDIFTKATALAFKDRDQYLDDPDFQTVPVEKLLDPAYLYERAKKVTESGLIQPEQGVGKLGDTTFSCAVDKSGNVVGVIQSLYWEWGSGVVAGDTGILLQNRGAFFSLDETDRNRLMPNKRPAHTLTCSLVFDRNGRPELIVGAMGGEGEPQTQATIISRIIDQGYGIQEAIDAPRFLLGRTWGDKFRGLRLEGRYSNDLLTKLENMGHVNVRFIDDYSDLVGHAQAIHIKQNGLEAAADPRAGGMALGF